MADGHSTELKITIPTGIMLVFIGSILFQSLTNLLLIKQRYDSDMEFMSKVKEIQAENARLRAELSKYAELSK